MKRTKQYVEAKSLDEIMMVVGVDPARRAAVALRIELARKIRQRITSLKLTHAEAATRAGVSRSRITAIANHDVRRVSIDQLVTIAGTLGLRARLTLTAPRAA